MLTIDNPFGLLIALPLLFFLIYIFMTGFDKVGPLKTLAKIFKIKK